MHKNIILKVAIPTPLWQPFDYVPMESIDSSRLQPGVRVKVPFGRREVIGILFAITHHSSIASDKLKPIIEVLDEAPLVTASLLKLYEWASSYYHYPIGEVIVGSLPKLLRQGKAAVPQENLSAPVAQESRLPVNKEQRHAIDTIAHASGFQIFLLSGVTGSGKTEVYLNSIEAILAQKKQALVLVPEISLTPQTVERFQRRFSVPIALMHSHLSDKTRMQAWLQAAHGKAGIIIGTRSAIFTPLLNPGIIILDEEHDLSFKQQSGFRYSARDLAIVRGQTENIPVVLGSATPSLESIYNAKRNRYCLLKLTERAVQVALPEIKIVDLRNQQLTSGLSEALLQEIEERLNRREQVMLFLNRRGYAPTIMCHACGWVMTCEQCDAHLTLHYHPKCLYCHHCGATKPILKTCPQCRQSDLIHLGVGTEQLESVLTTHFPKAVIVRVDRDSTRKRGSMQDKLKQIHNEEADILIGTQMLAKGHHFQQLTFVAIVDVDNGFFSSDFRAIERMGQLFVQVSGRAGREKPGVVMMQTHHPDNPLLKILLEKGYLEFAEALLAEREAVRLPPFAYLALLRAEATDEKLSTRFLENVKQMLKHQQSSSIEIYGPVPATMERKAGKYRSQLLVQSLQRGALQKLLKSLLLELPRISMSKRVRWFLDVDPQEI